MYLSRCCLCHASQGHPGRLRPRIDFEGNGLEHAVLSLALLEANDKGRDPVDHRLSPLKQQPCSLRGAGHQWLFVSIKHENHLESFPLPISGRVPLRGCLTRSHRLAGASLLANVGKACRAQSTDPTPAGLLTLNDKARD